MTNNPISPPVDVLNLAGKLLRNPQSHKGTYGRALVIGGSRGMSGAAALAGMAALRGGAGLVEVATPISAQPIVAGFDPCFLTTALPEDAAGRISGTAAALLREALSHAEAAAIGPGLDRSAELDELVNSIYTSAKTPLVVDADALNALAESRVPLKSAQPRILTPHPGEFARLIGTSTADVQANRQQLSRDFIAKHTDDSHAGLILVLKGHETIVADRTQLVVNQTGNPGMATGGTGDVLTGLIVALLAQGLEPFAAARLSVWLHGAAGDLAAQQLGQISLTARDVLDYLPAAFSKVVPPTGGMGRS